MLGFLRKNRERLYSDSSSPNSGFSSYANTLSPPNSDTSNQSSSETSRGSFLSRNMFSRKSFMNKDLSHSDETKEEPKTNIAVEISMQENPIYKDSNDGNSEPKNTEKNPMEESHISETTMVAANITVDTDPHYEINPSYDAQEDVDSPEPASEGSVTDAFHDADIGMTHTSGVLCIDTSFETTNDVNDLANTLSLQKEASADILQVESFQTPNLQEIHSTITVNEDNRVITLSREEEDVYEMYNAVMSMQDSVEVMLSTSEAIDRPRAVDRVPRKTSPNFRGNFGGNFYVASVITGVMVIAYYFLTAYILVQLFTVPSSQPLKNVHATMHIPILKNDTECTNATSNKLLNDFEDRVKQWTFQLRPALVSITRIYKERLQVNKQLLKHLQHLQNATKLLMTKLSGLLHSLYHEFARAFRELDIIQP